MRARWLLLGLSPLLSCEHELSFGALRVADADGGPASVADDAATADAALGPVPFSCTQRGPLYALSDSSESACPSALGHHYALCSCQDLWNTRDGILVDGFDSSKAAYSPGAQSGSLAVHGPLNGGASISVGGSLVVGGNVPLAGDLDVGGDLSVGGPLDRPFAVTVGRDARLAGDVRVNSLRVGGSLTLSETASFELANPYTRARLATPKPCRCAEPLDRGAIIDAAKRDNDNAAVGFSEDHALRTNGAPIDLALPCGRYFLREIYGAQAVTLRIVGRVALYIDDRILLDPNVPLTIRLEGESELDLFVRNDITANGPVTIGSPASSARTRVYAGNEGHNLYFRGRTLFAGSLYAPLADLVAQDTFELYGAAVLRRAGSEGKMLLHYDRALAGDSCQAARCSATAPCPPPLRCDVDRCLP